MKQSNMESWRGFAVFALGAVCALVALGVGEWAHALGHHRIGMAFAALSVLAMFAGILAWVRRG